MNVTTLSPTALPARIDHVERMLDEAVDESFPASDPPAATQPGSSVERLAASEPEAGITAAYGVRALAVIGALFVTGLLIARARR